MWTVKDKSLTYDQLKSEADSARKDLRLVSGVVTVGEIKLA